MISIRRLEEKDWQEFRSIRLRALQSDPFVFGSSYKDEASKTESAWKRHLKPNDGAVFMLYEDSSPELTCNIQARPIGMTGIVVDRDDPTRKIAVMWGSWLEPGARGKGLSQLMYQERIMWAKEHPTIEKIVVSHRASNLSSKKANQKHGFVFTHTVDKIWPDGTREGNVFYSLSV